MKPFYKIILTFLVGWLLSANVHASCCNAGFSTPKIQSIGKNWFRFVMHDSAAADIQSVQWSFGDSTFSNARTPIHGYSQSGDYSVTLTVIKKSVNGVVKSCTETRILPVIYMCSNFSYVANNLEVSFFQTPNFAVDSLTSWTKGRGFVWQFGDGQSSTELNPTHTYAQAGTYNVCMYQYKKGAPLSIGCSECHTIVVRDSVPPVVCNASFTYSLTDTLLSLQSNSTAGNSYWWVVGDTSKSVYGNYVEIVRPSEAFTVCHRQYTDSIIGPDSPYCTQCTSFSAPADTIPVTCNAAFTYSVSDTLLSLQSNSAAGNSYWWVVGDTSKSVYGNYVEIVRPSGAFTVCHRQYTDSIIGPDSPYCTECASLSAPIDTVPSQCNADFNYYILTDSTIAVHAMDSVRASSWSFTVDGSGTGERYYGNNTVIVVPTNGELNICQFKYSVSDSCIVCKTIVRERPDTIPSICNSDFDYTVIGNTVFTYGDSTPYFNNHWEFSNEQTIFDTLNSSFTFTSPGMKRICQSRVTISTDTIYADTCTTCKDIMIEAANITIHPNPAVHNINVRSNDGILSSIEIYDINGTQVKNISGLHANKYIVQVSDLVSGIYYVSTVLIDGRVNKTKIIIQ